MTDTTAPSRKPSKSIRYRAYFWLMDACLVLAPLGAFMAIWVGPRLPKPRPLWFELISWPLEIFVLIIPVFLICAKFMRDDYAEGLWRRTLVVVGVMAAVAPMVIAFAYAIMGTLFVRDSGWLHRTYARLYYLVEVEMTARQAMLISWLTFLLAFVVIFQFLRWKDSRP